jgi:hypothetical protein
MILLDGLAGIFHGLLFVHIALQIGRLFRSLFLLVLHVVDPHIRKLESVQKILILISITNA